jgi:hypothetical protein
MKKFVWDTSAILNIKEPNHQGYSPRYSLMKDLVDGWIPGPYLNIFPAIAAFEVDATVSRMHREGKKILRDFYIFNENSLLYSIDQKLIRECNQFVTMEGFCSLRGADLIFACIAKLENAYLVTLDNHFDSVSTDIVVINLNASRDGPIYRRKLGI